MAGGEHGVEAGVELSRGAGRGMAVLLEDALEAAVPGDLGGLGDPVEQVRDPEHGLLGDGDELVLEERGETKLGMSTVSRFGW